MKKIISIEKDRIAENKKLGLYQPVIVVAFSNEEAIHVYDVRGTGEWFVRYQLNSNYNADAWVETDGPIMVQRSLDGGWEYIA